MSGVDPVVGVDPVLGIDIAAELQFALKLADLADVITKPHYDDRSFSLDWKANRTEVTEADRDTESAISARVLADRPHHGLFGEEHGLVGDHQSPWRWIIDPIDGTSNFVRGIPVWATLVALTHIAHGAVIGVVSAPDTARPGIAAVTIAAATTLHVTPFEQEALIKLPPRALSSCAVGAVFADA